jgi:arginine decarboxylase
MSAYHAVFVTSIRDEIETFADDQPEITVTDDDPQVIMELKALYDDINSKNYREYYHDALDHKDELHTQFNLGLIDLEDRAKGEVLFWEVCARASKFARGQRCRKRSLTISRRFWRRSTCATFRSFVRCRITGHRSALSDHADSPAERAATDYATFVDITCDSDGHIDKFVDLKDVKEVLELHPFTGRPILHCDISCGRLSGE